MERGEIVGLGGGSRKVGRERESLKDRESVGGGVEGDRRGGEGRVSCEWEASDESTYCTEHIIHQRKSERS